MDSEKLCSLVLGELRPADGTCVVVSAQEILPWPDFTTNSWLHRPTGWAVAAVAGPTDQVGQVAADIKQLIDAEVSLQDIREYIIGLVEKTGDVFASLEELLTGDEWPKTVPLENLILARSVAAEAKETFRAVLEPDDG